MKAKRSARQRRIERKNRNRTQKMLRDVSALMATASGPGEYHVETYDFGHEIYVCMAVGELRWGVAARSRGRVMWCKRQWTARQIAAQATTLLNQAASANGR